MNAGLASARTGLRERKRRETRQLILAEAIVVFRNRGVRAAHLAEIARSSRVSQATLFNYFPNKGALAEAWVRGEIDQALERAAVEFDGRGLRAAMRTFCRQVSEIVSGKNDRNARLEAWRESGRANSALPVAAHPLVQALRRWQESEHVRGDIDAQTITEMLLESIEGGLIAGLRRELLEADLTKALRTRVDLVLDGARKRNERVTAPTAGGSTSGWLKRPVQSR